MRLIFCALVVIGMLGCARTRSRVAEPCPYPNQAGELVNSLSVNDPAIQIDAEIQTNKVIEEDRNELSQVSYQVVTGQADSAQSDLDTKEEEGSSPSENEIDSSAQLRLVAPTVEISSSNELSLDAVIASVYNAYPSLEAALHQRGIVNGELISAQGAFDTKFKAASENTTVGFYENYRNSIGLIQPLYQGGEVFAGYRIGRGSFEPWYKERQTNGGGEFKAGVVLPLAQDRTIDERRAEQWRTQYERHIVEAEIQAQLISFVQSASIAYWEWVAAGESYRVATQILELAESRSERIRSQVENGLLDPPELTDNLRLIAERQAKLAQTSEKLQKAAIKLSLYYRGVDGRPIIPSDVPLPKFPNPTMVNSDKLLVDSQVALNQRPELVVFELVKKQLDIDYTEACNQLRPEIDAVFAASKDTGEPTSSKNDKGPFQLDASLFVNVPLQRRKAKGKIHQIESKVSQLNAKRRLTEDNIVADVQSAYASLTTAFEQVKETQQAVTHAEELAQRERRNFELGSSDLLKVTLREQYAVESRQKNINARLSYFVAQANYRASLAQDALPR